MFSLDSSYTNSLQLFADFNGDGIPDRFVTNMQISVGIAGPCANNYQDWTETASVGFGVGNGTFSGSGNTFSITCQPVNGAVVDVNNDGSPDIILGSATSGTFAPFLSVYSNDGKGNFTATSGGASLPGDPTQIAVADFNQDGNADLAIETSNPTTINIALGDGTGNFTLTNPFPSFAADSINFVIGDMNNDGIPDIVTTDSTKQTLTVYYGIGNGTFYNTTTYTNKSLAIGSYAPTVGDFNKDGNLDIALVNNTSNAINILWGDGTGGFTSLTSVPSPLGPGNILAADVNADGAMDIISSNGETTVAFIGNGKGTFQAQPAGVSSVGTSPSPLVALDLNGDGLLDIPGYLGSSQSSTAIASSVALPPSSGTYGAQVNYPGDSNYLASSSLGNVFLYAVMTTPKITLTGPSSPAAVDYPLTFTATITGVGATPTGTVNFYNGSTLLGTGTLSNGVASYTTTFITVTTYTITAAYQGDTNYNAVTSAPFSITTAVAASTTVKLTSSLSSAAYGTPVTLTATVSGSNGTPTGTVNFLNGTTTLGTVTLNNTGAAALTLSGSSSLPQGADVISAQYSGSTQYAAASATPITVTVGAPLPATATTLAVTAAGSPVTSVATNTAVTLTATVTAAGSPVSPGQVNFCDATATYCTGIHLLATATLTSKGTAAWKYIPGVGAHSYKAVFQPTALYTSSSSATAALTVAGKVTAVTSVVSSGTLGNYTLTATVAGAGVQAPTGTVSFADQSEQNAPLGSAPLTANPDGFVYLFGTAAGQNGAITGEAVADFNGDGIPDLIYAYNYSGEIPPAVVNKPLSTSSIRPRPNESPEDPYCNETPPTATSTDPASVFLGDGNGNFTPGVSNLQVSCVSTFIAAGDFNGDGFIDLAFSGRSQLYGGGGGASVLIGDGTGNFFSGGGPDLIGKIIVGDFNGDGNLDINNIDTTYLGDGTGNFTAVTAFTDNNLETIWDAAVGDFNGDGIPDLAVVYDPPSAPSTQQVEILLGVGDGTFVAYRTIPALTGDLKSIFAGDFNNDGKLDLAVVNNATYAINILLGDGTGNFTVSAPLAGANANGGTFGIVIGDFNNDGNADIAANQEIFLGDGTGAFTAQTALEPTSVTIAPPFSEADLNGDGIPDLIDQSGFLVFIRDQSASATLSSVAPQPPGSDYHAISATYSGDGNYLPGDPGFVSLQTGLATPQVTVTASLNPTPAGSPVTFTATVTGSYGQPTGAIDFFRGATPLGTATLVNGVATFTLNAPSAGTYSVTASYLGDTNYNTATSPALSLTTYALLTPTIKLGPSTLTTSYSSPVSLTATISGTSATPSGTVTFQNGATSLGTAALNASGVATITVSGSSGLPGGTDSVTASYSGDTHYAAGTSSPVIIAVSPTAPSLSLTASTLTPGYNSGPTFTAALTYPGAVPTGMITFNIDGKPYTTGSLSAQGTVSLNIYSPLLPGPHTVTATYAGDSDYSAATSNSVSITVGKDSSLAISFSPAPYSITYGSAVTFSSTITGITGLTPTGTVTFSVGSVALGTATLNANGAAQLVPSPANLPAGTDTITLSYSGDANYAAATSSGTLAVSKGQPSIAITTSAATSTYGSPITLTATIAYPGAAPTGQITLYDGATAITSLTPTNGVITYSDSTLSVGSHSIFARYAGDTNYGSAESAAKTVIINDLSAAISLTSSAASVVSGSAVTFTAALSSPVSGLAPTGTVTFLDGSTILG